MRLRLRWSKIIFNHSGMSVYWRESSLFERERVVRFRTLWLIQVHDSWFIFEFLGFSFMFLTIFATDPLVAFDLVEYAEQENVLHSFFTLHFSSGDYFSKVVFFVEHHQNSQILDVEHHFYGRSIPLILTRLLYTVSTKPSTFFYTTPKYSVFLHRDTRFWAICRYDRHFQKQFLSSCFVLYPRQFRNNRCLGHSQSAFCFLLENHIRLTRVRVNYITFTF